MGAKRLIEPDALLNLIITPYNHGQAEAPKAGEKAGEETAEAGRTEKNPENPETRRTPCLAGGPTRGPAFNAVDDFRLCFGVEARVLGLGGLATVCFWGAGPRISSKPMDYEFI